VRCFLADSARARRKLACRASVGAPMYPTASDPLGRALDEAISGRPSALHALLARGSKLPGTRANDALADAFAQACRARGSRADSVVLGLARLDEDQAPGATALEFLPVCGVLALGTRAAMDEKVRAPFIAELHARADDLRFRVRDAVVDSLARTGARAGDWLVAEVASWMDGYFHAAAVVRALSRETWLSALHDPGPPLARLDEAFELSRNAPRAAARYPGRKALVEAISNALSPLGVRFGSPFFDTLSRWAITSDPELREMVTGALTDKRLESRFGPELARVKAALDTSRAPVRNPDHDKGPTRDRSGARRRGRPGS
jgi:hypothetical protein